MVEANRLVRRYGALVAVDSLTFEVPRGAVVAVLGPNGAGKTTTLRMLVGVLPPTSGSVTIDGIDLAHRSLEARRRIGYLPESTPLNPELRVDELLRFQARVQGLSRSDRLRAVDRAIDRCQLAGVRRRLVGQLSKGFRQRVGLAAAIVHEPGVVVLDEPTSGLDPAQIQEFRALLRALASECTVLLSSHVLPEVEATCDRVLMIARGRLVADGPLNEVRRRAGATRLTVETDRDCAALLRGLREIASATEALRSAADDQGWRRWEVVPVGSAHSGAEAIARACAAAGVLVRRLEAHEPTLEELFQAVQPMDRSTEAAKDHPARGVPT